MAVRSSLSVGKAVKLQYQKVEKLCTSSQFPKPSSGPDWSLYQTDSGPRALCLTPVM